MHELSVASAILDTARRHAGDRRVTVVSVRVGGLRQVIPDSLLFYWDIVTRDTECEGARLALTEIAPRLRCPACAYEWDLTDPVFRCPGCGSGETAVVAGEELEVEFIEVEEAPASAARTEEAVCIGPR